MIKEVLLGLFSLALGWLCLSHASRARRIGHRGLGRARPGSESAADKPLMTIPTILGIIFLGVGEGLLVLVMLELF